MAERSISEAKNRKSEEENNDYSYVMTERDFLSLLIELYRKNSLLWKVKHEHYCNKRKRYEALMSIVNELKEYKPDYTVAELKKRINILRTNFNKERRKKNRLMSDGEEEYKSKLWYFNELLFLADQPNFFRTSTVKEAKEERPEIEEIEIDYDDQYGSEGDANYASKTYYGTNDDDENTEQTPKKHSEPEMKQRSFRNVTVNKRRLETDHNGSDSEVEQYMTITTTYYKKKKTKEEILAKSWAEKLKSLAPSQKIFAEKIINDVLYEGELGNLTKEGVSFCPSFPS